MELVYLWVEDYKNIHRQGFNFSSKFICDYDGKTLTIDDNLDHIENFFGDNINVTAIVGKNGSGKSSLFETLTTFSYQEFLDEQSFIIKFDGKSFGFKQSITGQKLDFKIKNNTKYDNNVYNRGRTIDTLYFANDISTIFNNPSMICVKEYEGKIDAFKCDTYDLGNQKYNYDVTREKVKNLEIFNIRFQIILQKDNQVLSQINQNIVFDGYKRELHFYEMISFIAGNENYLNLIKKENLGTNTIFKKNIKLFEEISAEILLYRLLIIFRIREYQISLYREDKDKKFINQEIKKLIESISILFNQQITLKDWGSINKIIETFDRKNNIYTLSNVQNILDTYNYTDNEIWIKHVTSSLDESFDEDNILLRLLAKETRRINFINKKYGFNYFSLSSGERTYLELLITYIFKLQEDFEKKDNQQFIFLFDEIDLGLHPNWQKRIIFDITYYAQKYISDTIQLIFTSHSPFLLSDIPKENIIFLDKDEEGKCKVVDGLKEKKQTFGANIHTLLSDSFFMEDGLMGEFAKGKINEIIEFHKEVEKEHRNKESLKVEYLNKQKKFWQTQSIVGDAYLQQVLENHLIEVEKILLGKDGAKVSKRERLLAQIKELDND